MTFKIEIFNFLFSLLIITLLTRKLKSKLAASDTPSINGGNRMEKTNNNNFKSVLKSAYTLRILWNIYKGYRPTQIAELLDISQQNVYYYTNQLIDAKLIEKLSTEH